MIEWIAAAALGAAVGLAELVSRYRDNPGALPRVASFWVYLALNALASLFAYALIQVFGWGFGLEDSAARNATRVLVAGLAAMALFRSSLLNLKIGDQEVSIGPNAVLTSLLAVADRSVDRCRATQRSTAVAQAMGGVTFAKAKLSLPAFCLQLMQNLPLEEQTGLRAQVEALDRADMGDDMKSLNMGLLLMNSVGPSVLSEAVRALGDKIR